MNWVTSIGSVAIFVAPFITGCGGWLAALWTGLIMGMLLASLSYMKNLKWAAVADMQFGNIEKDDSMSDQNDERGGR